MHVGRVGACARLRRDCYPPGAVPRLRPRLGRQEASPSLVYGAGLLIPLGLLGPRGFKSLSLRSRCQSVRRTTCAGSSVRIEHLTTDQAAGGSNPSQRANGPLRTCSGPNSLKSLFTDAARSGTSNECSSPRSTAAGPNGSAQRLFHGDCGHDVQEIPRHTAADDDSHSPCAATLAAVRPVRRRPCRERDPHRRVPVPGGRRRGPTCGRCGSGRRRRRTAR
jgi:hypothetical protein